VKETGVHTTGVIIASDTLTKYIPLAKDKEGEVVTQYDIKQLNALEIPIIDLFGLKILTIIDETIKLIEKRHGIKIDLANLSLDDEKTFKLLQEGDTVGIFQLESQGMRNLMKRLRPSTFEDIVNLISLYRPGPLSSGIVESYIRRKHGLEPVNYVFPELETCLKDTYGLFLYREQIMQAANIIAGYSLAEADILCRVMEKEGEKRIEERRNVFVKKAVENGFSGKEAEKLFNSLVSSVKHSFRKFDAVIYGFIAYTSAYLKANYPEEFSINLAEYTPQFFKALYSIVPWL
jgi:DNA polymerase-3 subunit alpha